MTEKIIILAQGNQMIADKIKIQDVQRELFESNLEPSLKLEIGSWLQRAYTKLEPLKTN